MRSYLTCNIDISRSLFVWKKNYKAAFNLEISQNGSYVPQGILNLVISKIVWVKSNYDIEIFYNWHHQTVFTASLPSLSSPSLCFWGSAAISFSIKNELSFCYKSFHNEMKTNEKSQQMKCELISKATYAESWNVCSSLSWNCVECLTQKLLVRMNPEMTVMLRTHFGLVSSPIFQNLLLLLPATLEVLAYEVTSFFQQYHSPIISFCIRIKYSVSLMQKLGLDWTL